MWYHYHWDSFVVDDDFGSSKVEYYLITHHEWCAYYHLVPIKVGYIDIYRYCFASHFDLYIGTIFDEGTAAYHSQLEDVCVLQFIHWDIRYFGKCGGYS